MPTPVPVVRSCAQEFPDAERIRSIFAIGPGTAGGLGLKAPGEAVAPNGLRRSRSASVPIAELVGEQRQGIFADLICH